MTADVRPPVRAAAIVLFAVMVAHALLETARDALFLAKLGPDRLALAYLTIAATALATLAAMRRWAGIRDPRHLLIGFLVVATAGTAVLAATLGRAPWIVFVLYIWTGFVATLVVPCFWTLVDRSFDVAQAKRAFAAIGAGGVGGALVGSAVAAALGRLLPAHHLVTAGALVFALATVAAVVLAPRPRDPLDRLFVSPHSPMTPPARGAIRYVRLLVAVVVLSTITLTLGDLLFKHLVAERLDPEDLASVLGSIYTALNVVGLLVQLVIAPRLLARFGVGPALFVLPLVTLTCAFGYAATGALFAGVALKLADGGMRHSLHRVASEILYLPVPSAIRDHSKPIADAFGHRGGQALAALLVLALASLGGGARMLSIIAGTAGVVWCAALVFARRAYVQQFREMLRAGETVRETRVPELDARSIDLLTESLSSPDEVEALAALDLIAQAPERVPALLLYHPRKAVVCRALDLLAGRLRPDVMRVLEHLLDHPDPDIRAAALAAASRAGDHREHLRAALDDDHPIVRATALVRLAGDAGLGDRIEIGLARMRLGSLAERVALTRAIRYAPAESFREVLEQLLADEASEVVREVLHVYERAPHLADLPRLVPLLENAHLRADARRVIVASGSLGLELLVAALEDPSTPLGIRRHLPRTISRFKCAAAVDALVRRLLHEPDGTTEYKLLRALGRMRADDATLRVDSASLRRYARRATGRAARFATLLDALHELHDSAPGTSLLEDLLAEKRRNAIEHAFRAMGILHPHAQLRSVHAALTSSDDGKRAAAREILDELVTTDMRGPLLAVLEDLTADERRARLGALAAGPFPTYEALLGELLAEPSESIRCVAAYHVAERQLSALRPQLQRLRPLGGPTLVMRAFDQALARLHG